ncbi:MAG: hypothetical protein ACLUDI_04810 [Flavonifractor plautii]
MDLTPGVVFLINTSVV